MAVGKRPGSAWISVQRQLSRRRELDLGAEGMRKPCMLLVLGEGEDVCRTGPGLCSRGRELQIRADAQAELWEERGGPREPGFFFFLAGCGRHRHATHDITMTCSLSMMRLGGLDANRCRVGVGVGGMCVCKQRGRGSEWKSVRCRPGAELTMWRRTGRRGGEERPRLLPMDGRSTISIEEAAGGAQLAARGRGLEWADVAMLLRCSSSPTLPPPPQQRSSGGRGHLGKQSS